MILISRLNLVDSFEDQFSLDYSLSEGW